MKNQKRNTTNEENIPARKREISKPGDHNSNNNDRKNITPITDIIKKTPKRYVKCY